MTKVDPPVASAVTATPAATLERFVRVIPEVDRAKLEKEIQGLSAKLKWSHIGEPLKDVYRQRIAEIQAELKAST